MGKGRFQSRVVGSTIDIRFDQGLGFGVHLGPVILFWESLHQNQMAVDMLFQAGLNRRLGHLYRSARSSRVSAFGLVHLRIILYAMPSRCEIAPQIICRLVKLRLAVV